MKKVVKKYLAGFLLFWVFFLQIGTGGVETILAQDSHVICENRTATPTDNCGSSCVVNGTAYNTVCSGENDGGAIIDNLVGCNDNQNPCVLGRSISITCESITDPSTRCGGSCYVGGIQYNTHCDNLGDSSLAVTNRVCPNLAGYCYLEELANPQLHDVSCEWGNSDRLQLAVTNHGQGPLTNTNVEFRCSRNCGGYIGMVENAFAGLSLGSQDRALGTIPGGMTNTLTMPSFDSSVKRTVQACMQRRVDLSTVETLAGCAISIGGGMLAAAAAPGPGIIVGGSIIATGCAGSVATRAVDSIINNIREACEVSIRTRTISNGVEVCSNEVQLNIVSQIQDNPDVTDAELSQNATTTETVVVPIDDYSICETNLGGPNQATALAACTTCMNNEGIWTAVGCIKNTPEEMIGKLITIGIGIAGGLALLTILGAAAMFTLSKGDLKKTTEAKEMITAAVIGLIFILFSVTILQIIGVDILKIPGFGGP